MEWPRYDEIRNLCLNQLAWYWMQGATEVIRRKVNKKIDSFAQGGLEHATGILSALWEIVNEDGDIPDPSTTLPAVRPFRFCLLPAVTRECLLCIISPRRSPVPLTGPL